MQRFLPYNLSEASFLIIPLKISWPIAEDAESKAETQNKAETARKTENAEDNEQNNQELMNIYKDEKLVDFITEIVDNEQAKEQQPIIQEVETVTPIVEKETRWEIDESHKFFKLGIDEEFLKIKNTK